MGAIISLGTLAMCCGTAAFGLCCSCVPTCKNSTSSRIMYALLLLLVMSLCCVLLAPGLQVVSRPVGPNASFIIRLLLCRTNSQAFHSARGYPRKPSKLVKMPLATYLCTGTQPSWLLDLRCFNRNVSFCLKSLLHHHALLSALGCHDDQHQELPGLPLRYSKRFLGNQVPHRHRRICRRGGCL